MVCTLLVCLLVLCFLGCDLGGPLDCSAPKLLFPPHQAGLLGKIPLLVPPLKMALAMHPHHLLQLSKCQYRFAGRHPDGLGWPPFHQGLTVVASWVIVHTWALCSL